MWSHKSQIPLVSASLQGVQGDALACATAALEFFQFLQHCAHTPLPHTAFGATSGSSSRLTPPQGTSNAFQPTTGLSPGPSPPQGVPPAPQPSRNSPPSLFPPHTAHTVQAAGLPLSQAQSFSAYPPVGEPSRCGAVKDASRDGIFYHALVGCMKAVLQSQGGQEELRGMAEAAGMGAAGAGAGSGMRSRPLTEAEVGARAGAEERAGANVVWDIDAEANEAFLELVGEGRERERAKVDAAGAAADGAGAEGASRLRGGMESGSRPDEDISWAAWSGEGTTAAQVVLQARKRAGADPRTRALRLIGAVLASLAHCAAQLHEVRLCSRVSCVAIVQTHDAQKGPLSGAAFRAKVG